MRRARAVGAISTAVTAALSGVQGTGQRGTVTFSTASSPPSWTDPTAVQPGWVYQSSYTVGTVLTADFGAAANSPDASGYSYQVLRDGSATGMPSGTNVSGFTYTAVSGDQFHEISFTLTASNAAGSDTTTAASVTIS